MAFPEILPKFNRNSHHARRNYEKGLLKHQLEALESLEAWFQVNNPEIAVVSMPTGSGKTGIMCCLPFSLGGIGLTLPDPNNFPVGVPRYRFDKPVLVLAPGNEIARQLQEQIHLDPFLVRTGIITDQTTVVPNVLRINKTADIQNERLLRGNDVVLANAQKFGGEWEDALPNDMFELVIVDEAHHYPARTWDRIVAKFKQHAQVVFFTATPYRVDGGFVVGKPFAYHLPLQQAVQNRIIRRTKADFLERQPNDENENYEGGIYQLVLERINEKQVIKDRDNPLPNDVPHMAIAITKDTAEADRVVELWNQNWGGDTAFSYHSKLPQALKQERMQRIRNNQVKLVVVVAMLQEGFDHPPISIAAILTNIGSAPKFVQFIGRAQRIYRSQDGPEADGICADIITHKFYDKQEKNYKNFESEKFIENE